MKDGHREEGQGPGLKEDFLAALSRCRGIVSRAAEATGVSRTTYYNWRREDASFRSRADAVLEEQADFVEGALLERIAAGDTTAIIFYLKTKGRRRGYSEKGGDCAGAPVAAEPAEPAAPADGRRFEARVRSKKAYIVRLLREQGRYTSELTYQVSIAAQLLVRADLLGEEIVRDGHRTVRVELSREGNERHSVDPKERLYLDVLRQSQRALQALGMNTDSRERRGPSEDGFADFMEAMSQDEQ